jgi:hypothetical protein
MSNVLMPREASAGSTTRRVVVRRLVPAAVTLGVFLVIMQRVPLGRLVSVLSQADYPWFLALMVPNAIMYFCWDTLVLAFAIRWFHGPILYRELLPARAASYVVALFNTNVARGALAAYLARRLQLPFLQLGSTVIFLVLTEYTHLVAWATLGLAVAAGETPRELMLVAPAVALFWLLFLLYTRLDVRPWQVNRLWQGVGAEDGRAGGWRGWSLLRTFRIASLRRYGQIIALRAPMFLTSLLVHYFAARAFDVHVPLGQMLAFLPVIFMIAALPITVAHLGTTQAAWMFFFAPWADETRLLAFSLAAHATFTVCRALLGLAFTPAAYQALVHPRGIDPARAN